MPQTFRSLFAVVATASLLASLGCGSLGTNPSKGGGGGGGGGGNTACSQIGTGQGASLNGFLPFSASSPWNQDISSAPVDPNSAAIVNFIGTATPVHPDFGAGQYDGSYMGIPYIAVD